MGRRSVSPSVLCWGVMKVFGWLLGFRKQPKLEEGISLEMVESELKRGIETLETLEKVLDENLPDYPSLDAYIRGKGSVNLLPQLLDYSAGDEYSGAPFWVRKFYSEDGQDFLAHLDEGSRKAVGALLVLDKWAEKRGYKLSKGRAYYLLATMDYMLTRKWHDLPNQAGALLFLSATLAQKAFFYYGDRVASEELKNLIRDFTTVLEHLYSTRKLEELRHFINKVFGYRDRFSALVLMKAYMLAVATRLPLYSGLTGVTAEDEGTAVSRRLIDGTPLELVQPVADAPVMGTPTESYRRSMLEEIDGLIEGTEISLAHIAILDILLTFQAQTVGLWASEDVPQKMLGSLAQYLKDWATIAGQSQVTAVARAVAIDLVEWVSKTLLANAPKLGISPDEVVRQVGLAMSEINSLPNRRVHGVFTEEVARRLMAKLESMRRDAQRRMEEYRRETHYYEKTGDHEVGNLLETRANREVGSDRRLHKEQGSGVGKAM